MNIGTRDERLQPTARFVIAAVPACAMVLLLFLIFWTTPFRIEGDIAYVAKAAQQYLGVHAPYNRIRLVDPYELSRDIDTWIFWWPPFNYSSFVVLLSFGYSLATSGRLLMLAAALIGTAGW